ncbi:meiotic recombination protein REC114 isoform X1 [Lingula anatina]|uniref:Meiotic recombination protein REC114 isoform X1 n=2 Tax=Lingula anatina TaxID=7574 RepID=A0A1S3ICC9_LINAN|nr:meiotic recombination protein REC114 isoform X1 [Lingula anatina]|eukprot:XP_013395079.1 meiotic recombination protein REC114 isoform X1 [Lingula anatina]
MAALKPSTDHYSLLKYARYVNTAADNGTKPVYSRQNETMEWKYYEATDENPLTLTLTESQQFVISYGNKIMESHYLVGSHTWLRGVCKGDSMMILCKIQNESRKFRLKFSSTELCSGTQQCASCTATLRKYFPLKAEGDLEAVMAFEECIAKEDMDEARSLVGEVSVADMAKALSGEMFASLPLSYHHSNMPQEELSTILRLCLSDSSFPAFVGEVEAELKNIVQNNKHS